jgi:hypothetical protein
MTELPEPDGYTLREIEIRLGLPHKMSYQLIRNGRLNAHTGVDGMKRVSRNEAVRFAIEERNRKTYNKSK